LQPKKHSPLGSERFQHKHKPKPEPEPGTKLEEFSSTLFPLSQLFRPPCVSFAFAAKSSLLCIVAGKENVFLDGVMLEEIRVSN
jgi:hypothetical protein